MRIRLNNVGFYMEQWKYPWKELFDMIYRLDLEREYVEEIYEEARCEEFWDEYTKWTKKHKKPRARVYEYISSIGNKLANLFKF